MSVLDGMHPQYEHSPPTSSRSTMAARRPAPASRPATCSPPGPAPITSTSYVSATRYSPLHHDRRRRLLLTESRQLGMCYSVGGVTPDAAGGTVRHHGPLHGSPATGGDLCGSSCHFPATQLTRW